MEIDEYTRYVDSLKRNKLVTGKELQKLESDLEFRKWADRLVETADTKEEPVRKGKLKYIAAPSNQP